MRKSILLSLLIIGCGHQKVSVPKVAESPNAAVESTEKVEVRKLTDKQKISLLRAEAHRRGLRWRIFCAELEDDVDYQFLAEAEKNTNAEPFILYLEDGAQERWSEFGATQADAAFNLYQRLLENEEPNYHGLNRPYFKHKMCPPELRGN